MTDAEIQEAVLKHLKDRGPSTFNPLLYAIGLTRDDYRRLDRLLQRLRVAGKIKYFSPVVGWKLADGR
jgi:hypothetical protein